MNIPSQIIILFLFDRVLDHHCHHLDQRHHLHDQWVLQGHQLGATLLMKVTTQSMSLSTYFFILFITQPS